MKLQNGVKLFLSILIIAGIVSCNKSPQPTNTGNGSTVGGNTGGNNGYGYGSNGNSGSGTGTVSSSNAISIANFAFSATTLTIAKGTTVTWTNNDGVTHTVTADDDSFNSGSILPGKTFSETFANAGDFSYHCSIHSMMKGTIHVQ